ncbi:MAG TPA: biotin/lipoyl-containing protein, partial [Woeseiaceae bacterium]|nr:biotin/lipoyl-containing protein [Woeseiaceae bacterium]
VEAVRDETGLPLHFHTHDTSGISAATVLAAIEAGADAVDGAVDSMSGLTSQPNLNSIVAVVAATERDPGVDQEALRALSHYWHMVRRLYAAFESDVRAGTADIYRHAMPGGQYTNLREQARALGIEHRWPEISDAYALVNEMLGDIIKVTPTSKVVGDMALYMVTRGLGVKEVMDPGRDLDFPESVVGLLRGDLGQPFGGFPEDLQKKALKGSQPLTGRPGEALRPFDFDQARSTLSAKLRRRVSETELSSWSLYPKVFEDYARHRQEYGEVGALPTPVFFYGMQESDEVEVEIERGKTLVIRYLATSEPDEQGQRRVFFELNGQPRSVYVADQALASAASKRAKAEEGNDSQVGSPMPGAVVAVNVKSGQLVKRGHPMFTIEAMKMQTVLRADRDGTIAEVYVEPGAQVHARDLLAVFE